MKTPPQMQVEPRFVFIVGDKDRERLREFTLRVVPLCDALKGLGPHEFLYYVKPV